MTLDKRVDVIGVISDKQLEQENGIKSGSWNVRTLNTPRAFQYVLDTVKSYKIQWLALQEVS